MLGAFYYILRVQIFPSTFYPQLLKLNFLVSALMIFDRSNGCGLGCLLHVLVYLIINICERFAVECSYGLSDRDSGIVHFESMEIGLSAAYKMRLPESPSLTFHCSPQAPVQGHHYPVNNLYLGMYCIRVNLKHLCMVSWSITSL